MCILPQLNKVEKNICIYGQRTQHDPGSVGTQVGSGSDKEDQTEGFLLDTSTLAQLDQSVGRNGLFWPVRSTPPGPQREEHCRASAGRILTPCLQLRVG